MATDERTNARLRAWISAIAQGDAAAFRTLYDATSAKLFAFALRILHKRDMAEEVLQESFVSIWNNAAGYQDCLSSPMTWMSTIVRNKAFDLLRRARAAGETAEIDADSFDREIMEAMESGEAGPLDRLRLGEDARALARCMAQLEGLHRQAIALAFYHDLSHAEVARQLQLPMGTVKTWIRRGLERLRKCLSGEAA